MVKVGVLFVCMGNICRSPMAEFVFRDMVQRKGLADNFLIASAATSSWELGNPPHPGTRAELKKHGIDCAGKRAVRLKQSDYHQYDLILGMDHENIRDMMRMFGGDPQGKIHLLKAYSTGGDIDDPWYSGDFKTTYEDVSLACQKLFEQILCEYF